MLDSYQTLKGCGRNTIFTATTANLDIITATGSSETSKVGILLTDFCVDGNAGEATNDCGIIWTYVDYSEIRNVSSLDNGEHSIYLYLCDWNTIFNCICSGAGSTAGICLNISYNNTVNQNRCSGNYWGIWLNTANHNIVANNVCGSNTDDGINLVGSEDNNVSANVCNSNTGNGMYVDGYRNIIEGNICNLNTEGGLRLQDSNHNSLISNNICVKNNEHGLYLDNITDCIVIGNSCQGNSQDTTNTCDEIFVSVANDSLICNNFCRSLGGAKVSRYGLNISDADSNNNKVINNDLYDDGFGTAPYNDDGTDTIYLDPSDTETAVGKAHTQGTDTTLGALEEDLDFNLHQATDLVVMTVANEAALPAEGVAVGEVCFAASEGIFFICTAT